MPRFPCTGYPSRLNVIEAVVKLMALCFDGRADRPLVDTVAIGQFAVI